MLQNVNDALKFFSEFSNLKRIPAKSQKECYLAIKDCFDFFYLLKDMDHWKPINVQTYDEFINQLNFEVENGHDQSKKKLAGILLKVLAFNDELHLAIKWFFKKKYFQDFFTKKVERRPSCLPRYKGSFEWILFKNLKNSLDPSLLEDLDLYKTDNVIDLYEKEWKEHYFSQRITEITRHRNSITPEENLLKDLNNRWPEIRHHFFWWSSERLWVERITHQLNRLQKVLQPIFSIIFEKAA